LGGTFTISYFDEKAIRVLYVHVWNLRRRWQSQRRRGRAELLEVSFQPGRGQQEQHAYLLGMDLKGVWDAPRTENQRAGRAADGLIADQRSDLALQDVEALVLVAMDVARRAIALPGECFDQRKSSLRLVTGGEESEQPSQCTRTSLGETLVAGRTEQADRLPPS
jgi:hypothetical protein